jgi:acyl-CoA synthetase (AMP-forming)/AMP-acid ligase II
VIGQLLFNANHVNLPAICESGRTWTYRELQGWSEQFAKDIADFQGERIGIWCSKLAALVAAVVAVDEAAAASILFSASVPEVRLKQAAGDLHLRLVVTDPPTSDANQDLAIIHGQETALPPNAVPAQTDEASGEVVLFTSGTSGKPRPAVHTWKKLAAAVSYDSRNLGLRWFSAYDPTSFAGIQVWLQALCTGGTVYRSESREPEQIAKFIVDSKIDCIAATPSFLRLLLMSGEQLAASSVRQITIGGEVVDQTLLDGLRVRFPDARLTQIYASTEMGSCFAVHDGQAGFPASFLSDHSLPCELRVGENQELEIRSRRAMLGYLDDSGLGSTAAPRSSQDAKWYPTGDLVDRRNDRYLFVGRKFETINVGGMKVYPPDVENCIRMLPDVELVRVFGIPSTITGQLVCADVQASSLTDLAALRRDILATCRKRLARHQIPAILNFKDRLELSSTAKLPRSENHNGH